MKSMKEFSGVFIHREPVDMRKGINGLSEMVQMANMGEITEPYLFVFAGRRRDVIKVLYFDRSGFAMWQKRLERDKFPWPRKHVESVVKLNTEQFAWLLDGFDVWKMRRFEEISFSRVC